MMLLPCDREGGIDYDCVPALTDWYIANGAEGLFAVCQSSEMYCMTLEERARFSACVVRAAASRVPVISSGNISPEPERRAEEVKQIAASGVDAVILITNQFASETESDEVWMENCSAFLETIPADIPLGFYECPYPYKRLISTENLRRCARTGRFFFLKDTCCDLARIRERLAAVRGTPLKLYNANSTTLLASLREGAYGFSGVMANFHPALYAYLCRHVTGPESDGLQDLLAVASLIERQYYPVNAKYHMRRYAGVPIELTSRRLDADGFTETYRTEVDMLRRMEIRAEKEIGLF